MRAGLFGNPFALEPLLKEGPLNDTQKASVMIALASIVSVIQGPPGTGAYGSRLLVGVGKSGFHRQNENRCGDYQMLEATE